MNRRKFLGLSATAAALALAGVSMTSRQLTFVDLPERSRFNVLSNPGVDKYTHRTQFVKYKSTDKRKFDISNCFRVFPLIEYCFPGNTPVAIATNCSWEELPQKQPITLSLEIADAHCTRCEGQIIYTGNANYLGHVTVNDVVYDKFRLENCWCKRCGQRIFNYWEPCNELQNHLSIF